MGATVTVRKSDFIDAMEENQKDVRKMVMDSYHDIEKGKGRDYNEFLQNQKAGTGMQMYKVMMLPMPEEDIMNNTDYIAFEKKAPETALELAMGFRYTIARLEFMP